jgi:hypothetical protein
MTDTLACPPLVVNSARDVIAIGALRKGKPRAQ